MTEQKKIEKALVEKEQQFNKLITENVDGIILINSKGQIQFANAAAEYLFGRSATELRALDFGIPLKPNKNQEIQILRNTPVSLSIIPVEMRVTQIEWAGEKVYLASLRDITDRKKSEEQLVHGAYYDSLTGLPNRTWFVEQLRLKLSRSMTYSQEESLFGVLFLDLDNFKVINDSLGRSTGDQLLAATAQSLKACLRPCDKVARLGGDEFAILLDQISVLEEATTIAERIQMTLSSLSIQAERPFFATASIGIVVGSQEYDHPETLMRDADLAMYRAKTIGQGRHSVFDSALYNRIMARFQLSLELREALDRQEFQLYYQPIVNLRANTIVGFEALIRWNHPKTRLIHPADFIDIAEETGVIIPLGQWVLEEACRQLKIWQLQFPHYPLTMSVNLSGQQLTQPDLLGTIDHVLGETGLTQESLKLEITETVAMENVKTTELLFGELQARGIQLSIDDFGTGYSSLSYLHQFPINNLKIDKSFVARMGVDRESYEIIRAIISLARSLGIDAIAEGIETEEQYALLMELGCPYGQGYLFSEPLSNRGVEQRLQGREAQCS